MITGKKEYRGWLFLLCAVFLAVLAAVARGGLTAKAAEVSLVRGDRVEYIGYSTYYYYIDGNLAYCLEPDKTSPGNGTYASGEMSSDELLAKAMYYVYGGPGLMRISSLPLPADGTPRTGLTACPTAFCLIFMTAAIRTAQDLSG